jgi:hypothetical protein
MTFTANSPSDAPLGVGSIVGDSFTILFRNFFSVMVLAIVPTLIGVVASGLLIGFDATLGRSEPVFSGGADILRLLLSILGQIVAYSLTVGLLVQLAYDAKLGRPLQLGRYVGPALSAVVPMAVLSLVVGILVGVGFLLLVVPGLWVLAVFSVTPVAVVIERAGFGGLGRSADLTKGYRWPIVGANILIMIIAAAINFIAMFVIGLIIVPLGGNVTGTLIGVLGLGIITSVANGLAAILISLIYARLREIKEGASVRDIAAVFD